MKPFARRIHELREDSVRVIDGTTGDFEPQKKRVLVIVVPNEKRHRLRFDREEKETVRGIRQRRRVIIGERSNSIGPAHHSSAPGASNSASDTRLLRCLPYTPNEHAVSGWEDSCSTAD